MKLLEKLDCFVPSVMQRLTCEAIHMVDTATATPLRRPVGDQITLINNSAIPVAFDSNENYINSFPLATIGTANGPAFIPALAAGIPGSVQFDSFPGVIWTRAATQTVVQVYP
jgi:hypothetical protein